MKKIASRHCQISCGSQVIICDIPVRIDSYVGCSHGCTYCFARKKTDIRKIEPLRASGAITRWAEGQRNSMTSWVDWNIPLHFGGMSDPLQPAELKHGETMRALEALADANYPYVLSSKGRLLWDERYLAVIKRGRAVLQVSHVSPKYDRLEPGAPTYQERLDMMPELARNCLRLNVRVQPYMQECLPDVLAAIPKYKAAGVHGVTVEGMKFFGKTAGAVRWFGDQVYPLELLREHFVRIKLECRKHELAFYSGENRLRSLSDDLCCCGIDGLDGFRGNTYNFNHLKLSPGSARPTKGQRALARQDAFRSLSQTTQTQRFLSEKSFVAVMDIAARTRMFNVIG
jgi:DNA repair photolyase